MFRPEPEPPGQPAALPVQLPEGYYLANFRTVLQEVEARYGDLLLTEERAVLGQFRSASLGAQRLYVRLLTRKGPWFRREGLRYEEIGEPGPCIEELIQAGLCEAAAALADLLPLLTRGDLVLLLQDLKIACPRALRREELLDQLLQAAAEPDLRQRLSGLLHPVKPSHAELWRRIFLLFFGNFEQDLATFVVAEVGFLRYENYALDPGLRSFATRADVDYLLSLRELRQQLEVIDTQAELEALTQATLAMGVHPGVRQQRRYQGLLNELGRAWERRRLLDQAMACYELSERPPSRERRVRITASRGELDGACLMAMALAEAPRDVGEARFARGFLERQRKRVPSIESWLRSHPGLGPLPEQRLSLPRHPSGSVERAALAAAWSQGWQGFFAENHLWRALFGLAFWDVLFADIPGAFLHRFQNGPLDLGSADFFAKRRGLIEARLRELESSTDLGAALLAVAEQKWGVASAFLSWRHLDRAQLQAALVRIEPAVLSEILRVMVQSPLAFDSGFPDLFLFQPESQQWQLWEVKGPGDTLRPEQEWWLQRFISLGCTAQVAWVRYADPALESAL